MKDNTIIRETENALRKGIDLQRELYKEARHRKDLGTMCACIENIKGEVKGKALQNNANIKDIKFIETVIDWYRSINERHKRKSPYGYIIKVPSNIVDVALRNLHLAYERVIMVLERMGLL